MSDRVHHRSLTPAFVFRPGITARLVLLGAGLWCIGVLTVHEAAPLEVFSPGYSAALLLLTVPLAGLTVHLVSRVAGGGRAALVSSVAIVSAPALLLDGVALTWAPWLYSTAEAQQRAAGAWLLWFVGVSLAIAMSFSRPGERQPEASQHA